MTRLLSLTLCVLLAAPGCAMTMARPQRNPRAPDKPPTVDFRVMADYIRQIPVGSRVKIRHADGKVIRAILMKHDSDPIVVQRRTRVPEPPLEIPVADILALELDLPNGGSGRNIAIGAAAAAGVTLGVLMLLAVIFSD